ncbi:MAG TPA: ankyrin repeat domain-containing protein, partial [Candidatus Acidoferrum sp.]|nr:ankyrin repeat domain-containing protein [Candidatus Acidoferrum sp.]
MSAKRLLHSAILLTSLAAAAFAQEGADRYYQAIRNNDLAILQALIKSSGVQQKDARGTTPLHFSAAYGSAEAMRILLAAGADPNARNAFDATPLMWSATEPEKVRMLVAQGADVNAKSKMGRTAIWIAAANDGSSAVVKLLLEKGAKLDGTEILAATVANDMATIRLLLEKGANVNAKHPTGITPLHNAAANGNTKLAEMLLARGADVNAATAREFQGRAKAGPMGLGLLRPLHFATVGGSYDLIKLLLDAGADINAHDVRDMTALMNAVATDHPDPRVVRLLIERGSDTKVKDHDSLTAADWAKKYNNPVVLRELGLTKQAAVQRSVIIPASLLGTRDARPAAAKSIQLLQRASGSFFEGGGCGSCHSANVTSIAVNAAKANGIAVNEQAKAAEIKGAMLAFAGFEQPLLQRGDPPAAEILTYG